MRTPNRIVVLLAGIAMMWAFVEINILSPWLGTPTYLLLVAVAGAGYLAAIVSAFVAREPPSGTFLIVCLVLAAAFRVPLLLTDPGNDVFRYVWDARVQRSGYNPYIVVPSDPALAPLHTDETRRINNADVPTPYPPGAQLFFRLVLQVSERAYAFKIALAICDVVLGVILWRWLIATGVSPGWVIAYAWNPLVILVTSGEGHLDLLGALWLMASVLCLTNGRRLLSTLCFAMAIAVKPLPIVLMPLYWRRVRLRDAAVAAALFAAVYAPYVTGGHFPLGSLGVFLDRFRFNHTVFIVTSALFTGRGAAVVAVIAGLAMAVVLRWRLSVTSAAAWAWPMATALMMSPVVYPWYVVWLAPFLVSVTTFPLLAWSVTVLGTYMVWHLKELGRPWTVPGAVLLFEFGTVIAVGVWVVLSGSKRQEENGDLTGRISNARIARRF
jgi:hypothetical protein